MSRGISKIVLFVAVFLFCFFFVGAFFFFFFFCVLLFWFFFFLCRLSQKIKMHFIGGVGERKGRGLIRLGGGIFVCCKKH